MVAVATSLCFGLVPEEQTFAQRSCPVVWRLPSQSHHIQLPLTCHTNSDLVSRSWPRHTLPLLWSSCFVPPCEGLLAFAVCIWHTRPFLLVSLEAPCAQAPAAALFPGAPGGGRGRGKRRSPGAGSFAMEEKVTTDLSLSYTTSRYVDYRESIEYKCSRLPYGLLVFAGVCMGISLCGLVGNGIVMWFLGFHMKQSPFIVYILNLAVADFSLHLLFFLLMLAILSLTENCSYLYDFISLYRDFVFVVEFLCQFFDLSSLGLLTAISVERCISVFFPTWYRYHHPERLSGVVSGVLWAITGFFVFSMYLSFNFSESYETVFAGVAMAIFMLLSLAMLIFNLSVFIKLRCGSQRRHSGKLYVTVLLGVIVFFAFGIPFSAEVFLYLPSSHVLFPDDTSSLLALLNCSINPIIYFLVGSCWQCWFQGSMKAAFRQVFEEETHMPEDTMVETTV
ncbi:mas-related G-protein coupled receptor member D-like [Falco biarmicus]|uniref:mas-related G-protein coupled receptor member D-like n=1 Tax=Falco biarmicus TaxID=345155 RepID=UPI000FFCA1FB|nr:mas-related G-protein coupled receptor member D-like [Falco biarmicus]